MSLPSPQNHIAANASTSLPHAPLLPVIFFRCIGPGSWLMQHSSFIVAGPIPAKYEPFPLGDQVLHYDCLGNPSCDGKEGPVIPVNQSYAKDIADVLDHSTPFARLQNGDAVPAVIAKMGTYMHMLADRASHWWCTDSPESGVVPVTSPNFTVHLDHAACNFVRHAMEHYWEQAVEMPLAPSSWAAMGMYYDELLSFKDTVPGAGSYFNQTFTPIPKQDLIGNPKAPGKLPLEVVKRNAGQRVAGLHRLIQEYGLPPVPGFETNCGKPW